MTAPMSNRAEQAKALIEMVDARLAGAERMNLTIGERIAFDLAAALTASEAEVTRLETGIAEALAFVDGRIRAKYMREVSTRLSTLSQPTTDTNGAHA